MHGSTNRVYRHLIRNSRRWISLIDVLRNEHYSNQEYCTIGLGKELLREENWLGRV